MLSRVVAFISLAAALAAATQASYSLESRFTDVTPSQCTNVKGLGTNIQWGKTCTMLNKGLTDGACWVGGAVPTAKDVAVFPKDTKALLIATKDAPFTLANFTAIIIEYGGSLILQGNAVEVNTCMEISGNLILEVGNHHQAKEQSGAAPALPGYGIDRGTTPDSPQHDCHHIPIGFSPRVCGPGWFLVKAGGSVKVSGLFASMFLSGAIERDGKVEVEQQGFMWGQIHNDGTFSTTGYTYMHGFLHNYHYASIGTLAFDKWATTFDEEGAALYINNNGTILFNSDVYTTAANYSDGTKGNYRAILTNHYNVTFLFPQETVAQFANTEFDIFNFHTVTWTATGYLGQFFGNGNFVNHATFVADHMNVLLNAFHSVGGHLVTKHWGQFNFGNGPVSQQALKLCELLPEQTQRRRPKPRIVNVLEKNGCWWYGSFCYTTPYLMKPMNIEGEGEEDASSPRLVDSHDEPLPARRINSLRTKLGKIFARHGTDQVMAESCDRRYSFHDTTIRGDGTGSVLSTLPIEVTGRTTVAVGGKWYAMTEHQLPPVYGGGLLQIGNGGAFFAGIEATFSERGYVVVKKGGTFAVPKHAKVHFANHSLVAERGSLLHVDGLFNMRADHRDETMSSRNCGIIKGRGRVEKRHGGDFTC